MADSGTKEKPAPLWATTWRKSCFPGATRLDGSMRITVQGRTLTVPVVGVAQPPGSDAWESLQLQPHEAAVPLGVLPVPGSGSLHVRLAGMPEHDVDRLLAFMDQRHPEAAGFCVVFPAPWIRSLWTYFQTERTYVQYCPRCCSSSPSSQLGVSLPPRHRSPAGVRASPGLRRLPQEFKRDVRRRSSDARRAVRLSRRRRGSGRPVLLGTGLRLRLALACGLDAGGFHVLPSRRLAARMGTATTRRPPTNPSCCFGRIVNDET